MSPSHRLVLPLLALLGSVGAAQESPAPAGAEATMRRVGNYIEEYFARAQRIVAEETVVLQPLRHDLAPEGFARRLVYELRLEWNPDAEAPDTRATVVRQLISASGPPLGPPDQPDCLDPRTLSPEPLAFLLPERNGKLTWKTAGDGQVRGRHAIMMDYRPVAPEPPKVEWNDDCAWIDLPGRTRGRIWVNPETAAVMRFDEHLVGMVDIPARTDRRPRPGAPMYFTIERSDTSIRYDPVAFSNPNETLLLPAEVQSLSVIRNSGVPRLRINQRFANYRRFVTDSRIVP